MATTPKRFVAAAQVTRDLLNTIQAGTAPGLNLLHEQLQRQSVCDFKQELITALALDDGTSLAQKIRTFVRNNGGDLTALKSAQRLYFNPITTPAKGSAQAHSRTTSQLTKPLEIAYSRDIVRDQATLSKGYTLNGNVLTFSRAGRYLINANVNWGVWQGVDLLDAATLDPSWRFSSSGTNRVVTASLNFLIEGSLNQGLLAQKLQPQTTVFYEDEIYPSSTRNVFSSIVLDVLDAQTRYGRIEKLTFEIERSPYVISYGTRVDNIGFFKTTAASIEDATNFIEVIEL